MNGPASGGDLGREETIFNAAVQLRDPAKRAIYLDLACEADPGLRARIEKLLASDAGGDFFEQPLASPGLLSAAAHAPNDPAAAAQREPGGSPPEPAGAASAGAPALASFLAGSLIERPGDTIGRYKLREKIGEGGCGVVYMAEQEEPVRRRVALKVIKLGMDTRQVVARFEAERQALALMDHPNIAKVLDAGATETGRPYFVMELVGGIKITDYCEQNHLNTRQRLDLFIQVCRAVQHAHQKGVIHRDIKPSNVLVATQDGVPIPKVIDFGIAKATQGRLTDQTVFTAFEQFLGTPAYMSPEQAQVGGLDVDTRSDIYSLGVLLYELLTGKTPFDAKELLAAGLEAMRRTIQEKEPPTPSTRLKQDLREQQVQGSAKSEIKNQKSKIANDLDWIVMKCLEKDRGRRYETANGLAIDIQRHLASEPVSASPPSKFYRIQKLVRRNKGAFAAAASILALLVLGVGVSTWQAIRATRAEHEQSRLRRQALAEAAKSQQVARVLSEMLEGAGPAKAQGHDATMLLQILDRTTERLTKELTNQPEVQLQLLPVVAETYRDLGFYKTQSELAEESLRLARVNFGAEHAAVALALHQVASARRLLGDYERAETLNRESLAMRRKLLGNDSLEVARSLNGLAMVLKDRAKLKEAEAAFREVLVILRKRLGKDDQEVANVLSNLAVVLRLEGKLAEAETGHRENLDLRRRLLGSEHLDVADSLNGLAVVLYDQERPAEAETAAREALAIRCKVIGKEHPLVGNTLTALGAALESQGKLAEAETVLKESLAIRRKSFGREHALVANSLDHLAWLLKEEGNLDEAERLQREAIEMRRKLLGEEHPDTANSLDNLGTILANQGKLAQAAVVHREALALRRKASGKGGSQVVDTSLTCLASVLLKEAKLGQTEKFIEAEALAHEALAIREEKTPEDWRTFSTRGLLGASLLGQRKYAEAEPLLVSGYIGMKQREAKIPAGAKARIKEALQALVELYEATGRAEQTREWRMNLSELESQQSGIQPTGATSKPR